MKNMGKMLMQAQQMQKQMLKVQEELAGERIEGSAGGGGVKVIATGAQEIIEIKINPEVVDSGDIEMLEDLVLVAVKDALEKSKKLMESKMSQITGGLSLPGMF